MKIVIRTKNIKLNKALRDFIDEKINSLEGFLKIFQNKENHYGDFWEKGKPKIEAWVEIGKITRHHQKGKVFRAEVQMRLPGKSVRTVSVSEDLRMAINETKDELQRELKQYKNKLFSKIKRRQRNLKKTFHLSPQARFYRKGRIREEGL